VNNCILLVEDSEEDELLLKRVLTKAGLTNPIIATRSGDEAIRMLTQTIPPNIAPLIPKVIFLDLRMPGMDGLDVLQWMKTQPQLKDILVVVLSHCDDTNILKRAYELGAKSFLIKPFRLDDLRNLVEHFNGFWIFGNETDSPKSMTKSDPPRGPSTLHEASRPENT
jgi:CheY-like chemotaxis protein